MATLSRTSLYLKLKGKRQRQQRLHCIAPQAAAALLYVTDSADV